MPESSVTISGIRTRELQALIGRIVTALEADKQLPEAVEIKPAKVVKNPFA